MDKSKWEYKKLGEVATFINGYAFKPSEWKDEGLPIIRIQNLTNSNAEYNYYQGNIDDKYIITDGDLLVSWSATLGAFIWKHGKGVLNQHIFKTVFDKTDIDKKFLRYSIISSLNVMSTKAHGITMRHITKKDFDNLKIAVPPLSTQHQIVSELDQLSDLISLKQQQIKEYDALAQSLFYKMFGDPKFNDKCWQRSKIKDIASVKIGPFGSLLHNSDYITGGTPLVNPVHMVNGKIKTDPNFTIDDVKKKKLSSYLLKTNDIIFGRRGDIGRCALITSKEDGFICGTGSLFVRFNIEIDPIYSLFVLSEKSTKNYLLSQAKGATMLNINCKIVENIVIPLPPLPLQQSFASKVQAIEHQKSLLKQSIAETQTLLDSRMQEYFG